MFPLEIVNSLTKPPSPFRFSLSGRRKGRVSLARFDPRQTEEEEGVRERAPHHGLKHGPFVAGWTKEVTQRHVYSAMRCGGNVACEMPSPYPLLNARKEDHSFQPEVFSKPTCSPPIRFFHNEIYAREGNSIIPFPPDLHSF